MNRPLLVLILVCPIAALAGWGLAVKQAHDRKRDAPAHAALAEQRAAKDRAKRLAALVRSADEVVLQFGTDSQPKLVPVNDPTWVPRLAGTIEQATCTRTEFGLWVSFPEIKLLRKGAPVVSLMKNGNILRILGADSSGDFIIEPKVADSIRELFNGPS